ncbi:MAG: bifunctional anthranilate synthase component I family protein/class IV aminotransferase [Magnetococcus sp. DMHC-8]
MCARLLSADRLQSDTNLLFDFVGLETPLWLHHPLRIHHTREPAAVADTLRRAEQEALAGHWVAGFIGFEAAAAFGLPVSTVTPLPLVWLAVFAQAEAVTFPALAPPPLPTLQPAIEPARYRQDLATILAHIGAGDSYQVNYTLAARLSATDPAHLFLAWQAAHRHPYAAWLHCDQLTVASFSPELFLQRTGEQLLTAPIKGTCARLADPDADAALGKALEQSAKERAEHVMIVDMARNDLGKVCQTGTVQVDHLFERRVFATVQHLESRVRGRQQPGMTWDRLMAALFPAASITGAPKQRTMEIIRTLEQRPRGLYTGTLLIARPGGDFISNVAIRTVTWQGREAGSIGLGGGIVADSAWEREWAEIADKGRFLQEIPPPLQLLETMRLTPTGEIVRLEQHLARLHHSARALGFSCDIDKIRTDIHRQAARWLAKTPTDLVVRLVLDLAGTFTLQPRPCPVAPQSLSVRIAPHPVDRHDPLLRHKTSRRQPFDLALARARAAGQQEALWFNALGHVTEGSIRAIAVSLAGQWYLPPLADGLLASIWRAETRERLCAREKSLTLPDILSAEEIRMGNSVQGSAQVTRLLDAAGRILARWEVKRRL